jgi:hypothetical protein
MMLLKLDILLLQPADELLTWLHVCENLKTVRACPVGANIRPEICRFVTERSVASFHNLQFDNRSHPAFMESLQPHEE